MGLEQKAVDGPTVQLERTVGAADPHGHVGGGGNGAEVGAVPLYVGPEAAEQVGEGPSPVCCLGGALYGWYVVREGL